MIGLLVACWLGGSCQYSVPAYDATVSLVRDRSLVSALPVRPGRLCEYAVHIDAANYLRRRRPADDISAPWVESSAGVAMSTTFATYYSPNEGIHK